MPSNPDSHVSYRQIRQRLQALDAPKPLLEDAEERYEDACDGDENWRDEIEDLAERHAFTRIFEADGIPRVWRTCLGKAEVSSEEQQSWFDKGNLDRERFVATHGLAAAQRWAKELRIWRNTFAQIPNAEPGVQEPLFLAGIDPPPSISPKMRDFVLLTDPTKEPAFRQAYYDGFVSHLPSNWTSHG